MYHGISTHLAGNIPAPAGISPHQPGMRECPRQRPGISPPAWNITKPAGNIPAQPVTFPTGAVIFPPDGNITVGPGGNITVTVKLPASGGNIPGQPVILPGAWDVLPQTGSPKVILYIDEGLTLFNSIFCENNVWRTPARRKGGVVLVELGAFPTALPASLQR